MKSEIIIKVITIVLVCLFIPTIHGSCYKVVIGGLCYLGGTEPCQTACVMDCECEGAEGPDSNGVCWQTFYGACDSTMSTQHNAGCYTGSKFETCSTFTEGLTCNWSEEVMVCPSSGSCMPTYDWEPRTSVRTGVITGTTCTGGSGN